MPHFSADYLSSVTEMILESIGTPKNIALTVSNALINANLRGHDSHGVLRIPSYLDSVKNGSIVVTAEPKIIRETATTAVLNAHKGWGHYSAQQAMLLAMDKARNTGIGTVTVFHCNHTGRMGEYVELAANEDYIGIATLGYGGSNIGWCTPFGGLEKRLATNPIAVAVPVWDSHPFILDYATTIASRGKVKQYHAEGNALPTGWITTDKGEPSDDPTDFFSGGNLVHMGDYKGYALSVATCLLGGLSGAFEKNSASMGGVFLQAIDIAAFTELGNYKKNVRTFLDGMRSSPAINGEEILVPGDPEQRNLQARSQDGITIPEPVWNDILNAAQEYNISLPLQQRTV